LIKKGDIEGLTSRLKELIEDPNMRREMGKRGRKFVVERFSIESLTIRYEEFYAKTLNK
jgi:glycosyltransferase involved in cell wall biosynthesis